MVRSLPIGMGLYRDSVQPLGTTLPPVWPRDLAPLKKDLLRYWGCGHRMVDGHGKI